jgi:putative transposase
MPGYVHHVTNRGNERRRLFFDDADNDTFLRLFAIGKRRYPVRVYGITTVINHFHALLRPLEKGALSALLHWVLGKYAAELRSRTGTVGNGHVFQQRFWSDVIVDAGHLLRVLRYVEANPVRAGLVARAELWPWNSASLRLRGHRGLLDPLPVELPDGWLEIINERQPEEEIMKIRWPRRLARRAGASDALVIADPAATAIDQQ